MPLNHSALESCGIQSLPQATSDKRSILFQTGLISIIVQRAITDDLMNKISQHTAKYLAGGSSRCFVIRKQLIDTFHLECAVSFNESRNCQVLQQYLRRYCITRYFPQGNPLRHCVEIKLQAVDDEDTSIFERLRAQPASGEWTLLYRKGDTTPPQPGGTLTETGVSRVGPSIALPVVADPVARAGLGVDRPVAAAGSSGAHSVVILSIIPRDSSVPACRPRRSADISLSCRTGGVRTSAPPPRPAPSCSLQPPGSAPAPATLPPPPPAAWLTTASAASSMRGRGAHPPPPPDAWRRPASAGLSMDGGGAAGFSIGEGAWADPANHTAGAPAIAGGSPMVRGAAAADGRGPRGGGTGAAAPNFATDRAQAASGPPKGHGGNAAGPGAEGGASHAESWSPWSFPHAIYPPAGASSYRGAAHPGLGAAPTYFAGGAPATWSSHPPPRPAGFSPAGHGVAAGPGIAGAALAAGPHLDPCGFGTVYGAATQAAVGSTQGSPGAGLGQAPRVISFAQACIAAEGLSTFISQQACSLLTFHCSGAGKAPQGNLAAPLPPASGASSTGRGCAAGRDIGEGATAAGCFATFARAPWSPVVGSKARGRAAPEDGVAPRCSPMCACGPPTGCGAADGPGVGVGPGLALGSGAAAGCCCRCTAGRCGPPTGCGAADGPGVGPGHAAAGSTPFASADGSPGTPGNEADANTSEGFVALDRSEVSFADSFLRMDTDELGIGHCASPTGCEDTGEVPEAPPRQQAKRRERRRPPSPQQDAAPMDRFPAEELDVVETTALSLLNDFLVSDSPEKFKEIAVCSLSLLLGLVIPVLRPLRKASGAAVLQTAGKPRDGLQTPAAILRESAGTLQSPARQQIASSGNRDQRNSDALKGISLTLELEGSSNDWNQSIERKGCRISHPGPARLRQDQNAKFAERVCMDVVKKKEEEARRKNMMGDMKMNSLFEVTHDQATSSTNEGMEHSANVCGGSCSTCQCQSESMETDHGDSGGGQAEAQTFDGSEQAAAANRPDFEDCMLFEMHEVERRLRESVQVFDRKRLDHCRNVGWVRTDIDLVHKGSARVMQANAENMTDVTASVPKNNPRKKSATSSGELSRQGAWYRRCLLTSCRLLYLNAAIRQHREADLRSCSTEDLKLAAVRAILSDLPSMYLRELSKDSRVQKYAVISEKKLRKRILKEIKAEVRETKQDPMTVLKATIDHSKKAGSIKAYTGMCQILSQSGFGHCLPSANAMSAAKKGIMRLAEDDLEVIETQDGYRINLKRAVEMEASRLMQTISMSSKGTSEARVVGVQPGGHGWQDLFDVKLTLDARRVTRHHSQTELMIIFMLKGKEGVDRCQKAVHMRTIAVWAGKDSKENVQRNMIGIMQELVELEKDGIIFSKDADMFLKVGESDAYKTWLEMQRPLGSADAEMFRRVSFRFWVPADMLAQCSIIGHGCSGNLYCPHCCAHKDFRHIPFELRRLDRAVNFREYAEEMEMHPETLWTINTCEDKQHSWKYTEEMLKFMTAEFTEPEALSDSRAQDSVHTDGANHPAPAQLCRKAQQKKKPAPKSKSVLPSGPHEAIIKKICWREHASNCKCKQCMIPATTVVRVMVKPGFSRESPFLSQHWPGVSLARFPFCALHCLMRITEAMFYNICQNALAGGNPVVSRLNEALEFIGFKSKKFQKVRSFSTDHFERLSFQGHEALHLLKHTEEGKLNIVVLLKMVWPGGDATETAEGRSFVKRSAVLWEQWAKVVALMTERDPQALRNMQGDGFAIFGKECRDFCFRYQSMFHKTHCKSFYLHTLLAHAGDFMRELERYDMCLGMMSNSGAERRHEYGRRAFKRSLCGGCWSKHEPQLANMKNLSAYLTLREILIWQYGSDLLSHELALRAQAGAESTGTGRTIASRSSLTEENLAFHKESLLSQAEYNRENDGIEECIENNGWVTLSFDKSKVLESIPLEDDESGQNYRPGVDHRLTNGEIDVISESSGCGSDDESSEDSEGDVPRFFRDFEDFPTSDNDDADYTPETDKYLKSLLSAKNCHEDLFYSDDEDLIANFYALDKDPNQNEVLEEPNRKETLGNGTISPAETDVLEKVAAEVSSKYSI